jgi:threonine dehydrogenase-like Zn-dependent dehydrogenase
METKMEMVSVEFVDENTLGSQPVAVMSKPYEISVRYAKIPEPGEGEVRVKIKYVGICGSDLEAFRGTRAPEFLSTPARLGHEVAGVIDKIGSNVTGLKLGDIVTCRYVWGAYAQYITCKPFCIKVLPYGFPIMEASLVEILPSVMHAAELAEINSTKNVLIMGQGVSGLVLTQVISRYSPRTLAVIDLYDRNLKLAKKYGASHAYKIPSRDFHVFDALSHDFPEGFDVVIPCLLEGDGMVEAIDCCALSGRIVMYGCIGVCNRPVDFFKMHRKRIDIFSTEPKRDIDNRKFFQEGLQMVMDGLINTREIVDAIIPLSEIARGFALRNAETEDIIHVLIDCEK